MKMKKVIAAMIMKAAMFEFISGKLNVSGKIWTMASPRTAPHPIALKRSLMTLKV